MELEAKLAALTASGAGKPTGSSPPASAAKSKGQVPKVANKSGKTGGAPKAKSKKHVPPPPESDENDENNSGDEVNEEGSDEDTCPSEGAKMGRLRRLCERKPSGRLNVPLHIHEQWKQGGHPRQQLLEMLEHAGFEKDPQLSCCHIIFIINPSVLCTPTISPLSSSTF